MVALAPNSSETSTWDVLDGFPKLHSRAREAKTQSCTEAPHSKSLGRVEIWLMIYESREGLESFTRDPIDEEFDIEEINLYEFVYGAVLTETDSEGLMMDTISAAIRGCAEKATPELQIECLELFISQGIDKKGLLRQAVNKIKHGKPKVPPTKGPKNPGKKGGKSCFCRCSVQGCDVPSHCGHYTALYKGACTNTSHTTAFHALVISATADGCHSPGAGFGLKHCNCITR